MGTPPLLGACFTSVVVLPGAALCLEVWDARDMHQAHTAVVVTHFSLPPSVVAFPHTYDFADSLHLCVFPVTVNKFTVFRCTPWAEQRLLMGKASVPALAPRCRGTTGLRSSKPLVLDLVLNPSGCYLGSSSMWKFVLAALFLICVVIGMQRHRCKIHWCCMNGCGQ